MATSSGTRPLPRVLGQAALDDRTESTSITHPVSCPSQELNLFMTVVDMELMAGESHIRREVQQFKKCVCELVISACWTLTSNLEIACSSASKTDMKTGYDRAKEQDFYLISFRMSRKKLLSGCS